MIRLPARRAHPQLVASRLFTRPKIKFNPSGRYSRSIQSSMSLSMPIRPVASSLIFTHIQQMCSGTNKLFLVYPVIAGSLCSGFKSQMADLYAQHRMEQTPWNQLDWTRNLLFFLFGSTYCGAITYAILVKGYSRMFPGTSGRSVIKRVVFDQCVTSPFLYFPCFYSLKCMVFEKENFSIQKWREYMDVYWNRNFYQDVTTAAAVWGPTHCITFTLIPNHLKLLWIGGVSAVWTVILSMMRGSNDKNQDMRVMMKESAGISMNVQSENDSDCGRNLQFLEQDMSLTI